MHTFLFFFFICFWFTPLLILWPNLFSAKLLIWEPSNWIILIKVEAYAVPRAFLIILSRPHLQECVYMTKSEASQANSCACMSATSNWIQELILTQQTGTMHLELAFQWECLLKLAHAWSANSDEGWAEPTISEETAIRQPVMTEWLHSVVPHRRPAHGQECFVEVKMKLTHEGNRLVKGCIQGLAGTENS